MTKAARLLGLGLIAVCVSGCYLGHVTAGQARLLWARQPIDAVVVDPSTPTEVRERLERVLTVRAYADRLGLDVRGRYRHYVPWPGDHIITTVVATRPGEVEAAGFWFPIVGRLPYKGYFDRERAQGEARRLEQRGLDVCTVPVRAYSTLGWFDDPVTGPMLRQSDGALVETLLHELVHATAFVAGDADFSEGVASFVGEEARVEFFEQTEGLVAARRERARVEEQRRVRAVLLDLRNQVEALYAKAAVSESARSKRRSALENAARTRVATLFAAHGNDRDAQQLRLNDACLALTATYSADTVCYVRLLAESGAGLPAFVARLRDSTAAKDPRSALIGSGDCAPPEP